jgi:hypothetical protein
MVYFLEEVAFRSVWKKLNCFIKEKSDLPRNRTTYFQD